MMLLILHYRHRSKAKLTACAKKQSVLESGFACHDVEKRGRVNVKKSSDVQTILVIQPINCALMWMYDNKTHLCFTEPTYF